MNPLLKAIIISGMEHQYGSCTPTTDVVDIMSKQEYPRQQLDGLSLSTLPSYFDVINGRGQGVHRHPGNAKYRTLVFLNKGLYAKCPRVDKAKVSRGIVAAVRELGGRFLELDMRSGIYHDIGDKKAWAKTSQALREGLTKIRQQIIHSTDESSNHDTSLLGSSSQRQLGELPAEGYFGHSVHMLESLYKAEEAEQSQPSSSRQISSRPSPMIAALGLVQLSQV